MPNLVFVSSTFHVPERENNHARENLYFFCYQQLERIVPKSFDIIYCDNSVKNLDELENNQLKAFLTGKAILFLDRNIGTRNIGMGELDELIYTVSQTDVGKYENIVYLTGRRMIPNPYIFEKAMALQKDALICNPRCIHIHNNYAFAQTDCDKVPNLYNDMFFAMKSSVLVRYANFSRDAMVSNIVNGVGSEQNLYNFIHEEKIDYEFLEHVGLIRIDYKAGNEIQLF